MAPPINISPATALIIGALPYGNTQQVDDAGVTYTVWYKYTGVAGLLEIGAFFSEQVAGPYNPTLEVFSPVSGTPYLSYFATEIPVQIPVFTGVDYFFRITPNGGNPSPALLDVAVYESPQEAIVAGSILVNDDTPGYPGVIIDITTGLVLNFISPFAAGEAGDVLSSGIICFNDFASSEIRFYDNQLNLIIAINIAHANPRIRTCLGAQEFYIGKQANPNSSILVYDGSGILQNTFPLTGINSLLAIAASNDETILYHSNDAISSPIRRWNIPGAVALGDLVAGIVGRFIADILVLSDDTIVASSISFLGVFEVKRYSSAGTLLNTYSIGTTLLPAGTFPRMAYAINDPTSFWVWWHPDTDPGLSRFQEIRVSDGVILTTVDSIEFESGMYQPVSVGLGQFGNSFSCPFVILRGNISATNTSNTIFVPVIPPPPITPNERSGIYKIVPGKHNDTLWNDLTLGTTTVVKIPNPNVKTGLFGE